MDGYSALIIAKAGKQYIKLCHTKYLPLYKGNIVGILSCNTLLSQQECFEYTDNMAIFGWMCSITSNQ